MNRRSQPHASTKKESYSPYDALSRLHMPISQMHGHMPTSQMHGRPPAVSSPRTPPEQSPYTGLDLATLPLPPQMTGALRSGPNTTNDEIAPKSVGSYQTATTTTSVGSVHSIPQPRVDPTPLRSGHDVRQAPTSARIVSSAASAADWAGSAGVDPARLPRPPH
jgi:hypothetical protein